METMITGLELRGFPFECLDMCVFHLANASILKMLRSITQAQGQRRDNLLKAWSSYYSHLLCENSELKVFTSTLSKLLPRH
jgi:hypothetical protein